MTENLDLSPQHDTVAGMRLYLGRYPSVTTILDLLQRPFFQQHRQKDTVAYDLKRDNAAALGTRVHSICERIARGEEVEVIPEDLEGMITAFRDFLDKHVDEVLATELSLTTERGGGFAGTTDLIVRLKDGKIALVDLKTARNLSREHGLQTAGYALLARDNGYTINKRLVVRLKKEPGAEGKYYVRTFPDHAEDTKAFLACLTIFMWERGAALAKLRKELGTP
jgi:hypothetical protein